MADTISTSLFLENAKAICDETFDSVKGIYLDKGTSLFETLASLTAEQASHPTVEGGSTIAGHVEHVRFYIDVLEQYMEKDPDSKIDWSQSWLVKSVTPEEWEKLKKSLRSQLESVTKKIERIEDWNQDRAVGGLMAILIHTAYHLGAIRQMAKVVEAS